MDDIGPFSSLKEETMNSWLARSSFGVQRVTSFCRRKININDYMYTVLGYLLEFFIILNIFYKKFT